VVDAAVADPFAPAAEWTAGLLSRARRGGAYGDATSRPRSRGVKTITEYRATAKCRLTLDPQREQQRWS
jgi:hypothetical protein